MKRIGDLILTAPALADLKKACPKAEIVLVAAAGCRDLAECLPGVARVLPYHPGRLNAAVWAAVVAGSWEVCLDFTGTDRSALLTRLSGAGVRLGYEKFNGKGARSLAYTQLSPASVRDLHTVDFHRALVAGLEGRDFPSMPGAGASLTFSAETTARVDDVMRETGIVSPFVILHPGTARREKFWPAERWIEVAALLRESGFKVVLTGTGTGLEEADAALIRCRADVVDLTGRLKLSELAALMGRAKMALGVDSMAMHLAALWQTPQIVLFGPTNPFHWRPMHGRAVVISAGRECPQTTFEPRQKGGDMESIQTATVTAAVQELLERL